MEFFNKCFSLLKEIVENKHNLSAALKVKSNFKTSYDKNNAVALCGSFLRNYYFIFGFVKNVFNSNQIDDVITIGILYVGLAFKKYFTEEYTLDKLNKYFKNKGVEITKEQIEEFNKLCEQQKQYTIPNLQFGSFKYFSSIHNLPIWLIKMLNSQYGRQYLIPFMRATSRMPNQYAFKNPFENKKQFEEEIKDKFKEVAPSLYRYLPQTSIKKEQLVKDYSLVSIQEAAYSILKYLPNLEDKDVAMYLGVRTSDFFLPLAKYGTNNTIIILEKNEKDNDEAMQKILKYKDLKSISRYKVDEKGVITYLDKPQDLIIYYPKSSSIDLVRREPEYSLIFDPSSLDDLAKNQEDGLKELSKHLNPNGHLVYIVNTINIKETLVRISKFLNDHKSFKLEKEETFFPQEKLNSIYYFAVLRKVK